MLDHLQEDLKAVTTQLSNVRDIAVVAKANADNAITGQVVQGRHIDLLDQEVKKLRAEIAALRVEIARLPQTFLWWFIPTSATVIAGLAYIILQK